MKTKQRKPSTAPAHLSADELALCAVIARILARTIAEGHPIKPRGKP